MPDLWPENVIPLHIYLSVSDQVIVTFGQPVGLLHSAIDAAMEREEVPIEDRREVLDRVVGAWRLMREEMPEGDSI